MIYVHVAFKFKESWERSKQPRQMLPQLPSDDDDVEVIQDDPYDDYHVPLGHVKSSAPPPVAPARAPRSSSFPGFQSASSTIKPDLFSVPHKSSKNIDASSIATASRLLSSKRNATVAHFEKPAFHKEDIVGYSVDAQLVDLSPSKAPLTVIDEMAPTITLKDSVLNWGKTLATHQEDSIIKERCDKPVVSEAGVGHQTSVIAPQQGIVRKSSIHRGFVAPRKVTATAESKSLPVTTTQHNNADVKPQLRSAVIDHTLEQRSPSKLEYLAKLSDVAKELASKFSYRPPTIDAEFCCEDANLQQTPFPSLALSNRSNNMISSFASKRARK